MAADEPEYTRMLVESLAILAADPQAQISYIDQTGFETDDLAEDHVAPAKNAQWMCVEGLISPQVRERAERIDAIFTAMSGQQNADRWTHHALATDRGWIEVRTLAREALHLLQTDTPA